MANRSLFATLRGLLAPAADLVNTARDSLAHDTPSSRQLVGVIDEVKLEVRDAHVGPG